MTTALSVSVGGCVVVLPLAKKLAPEVATMLETVALALMRPAPDAVPSDDTVTTAMPLASVSWEPAVGSMRTSVLPTSAWNCTISLATASPLRRNTACARTGCPARMLEVAAPAWSSSVSDKVTVGASGVPPPPVPPPVPPPLPPPKAVFPEPPPPPPQAARDSNAIVESSR